MVLADQLVALAEFCEFEELTQAGNWTVDRWHLSQDAIDKLAELYEELIQPASNQVEALLQADGVDLSSLLADEEHADDTLTRSDMTELAAAASAIASHDLNVEFAVLPNMPKGSRSASSQGIDVLATAFDPQNSDEPLTDYEWLLVCSVKHTVANGSDMRAKLDASLRITLPYLTAQVRVLHGRLVERGIESDRVYLFLGDFPDGSHLRILGVGCADADRSGQFLRSLARFKGAPFKGGHIRCLVIDGIERLHERIDI
jgi:hypothetical protein